MFTIITYILIYASIIKIQLAKDEANDLNIMNEKYTQNKENNQYQSFFEKDVDLFLPKYDFLHPDLQNEDKTKLPDYLKGGYFFSDDILEISEEIYRTELLDSIIKKEVNIEMLGDNFKNIYSYPDLSVMNKEKPKLISGEFAEILSYKNSNYKINFEPKFIYIVDKPICIPTMTSLTIRNGPTETTIESIRSDLYQATIFFVKGKDTMTSLNQKTHYPKVLTPFEVMSLQIIILPDMIGEIKGSLYLELSNKDLIVFSIKVKAIDNIYNVSPIYSPSWLGSKQLTHPISIFNPHGKTLIIKDVINSFSSLSLIWPNGQPVGAQNNTAVSTSMLEIPPKTTKTLMHLNFYKDVSGVEYGLLNIKTDKDTLIVPVLVRVEIQGIQIHPTYFNFGFVDTARSVKHIIPISISNVSKQPIQIRALFSKFEDKLVEFIPDPSSFICDSESILRQHDILSRISKTTLINGDNYASVLNSNLCVISPGESITKFGYLVLDPQNIPKDAILGVKHKNALYLQTNFTENPFISLEYEYIPDIHTIQLDNSLQEIFLSRSENSNSRFFEFNVFINSKASFNIKRASSSNEYMTVLVKNSTLGDKNEKLGLYKFQLKLHDYAMTIHKPNSFDFFITVETTNSYIGVLPMKFYDKSLLFTFCENVSNLSECHNENYNILRGINFESQKFHVDFGLVSTIDSVKRFFFITNDNPIETKIIDITTSTANVYLQIETVEHITTGTFSDQREIYDNSRLLREMKRKNSENSQRAKIEIKFPPYTTIGFSIVVVSNNESEITGNIVVKLTPTVNFQINIKAKFLKGNLNITPSIIRFEPAFPGLFQTKMISSKSSYPIPISLISSKSNDPRILPTILTNTIISNNRTEILKVVFDPSKVNVDENFMKGDHTVNSTSRYISYRELYLWKEKQKLWEMLGSQGRTEINTSVKIKTNVNYLI